MPSDDRGVGRAVDGREFLALYERALPEVYGYLLDRCRDTATAEDLTSETFLAAVGAVSRPGGADPSIPWLIGVARHKLVDHWRRRARDDRLADELADASVGDDPWDAHLTRMRAADVLAQLGDHHRVALTLRYVDGLPVPEVADLLDRTVHATEALLVRARVAFRARYEEGEGDG
jgi:RNA polymerase sigma-70 factor (ECF subfamily)